MITCSNCGERNPERARCCLRCGSSLTAAPTPDEERKIVTVLFCEAVGVAGRMGDPEDLKAALAPFHALLKRDVEGYGGTVDKFMGPVVMSVFGAPVQHEDDPHRAVLAALKIQRSIDQLNDEDPGLDVRVRMGANTGKVVVAFGVGPQIGERVTGDAVNTASRLQTSADVGEIVVGEPTYEATAHKINYEPLAAVTVKGKAEPLRRWRPVETRSHMGFDMRERTTTPFVGRGDERALLEGPYRRMITEQSVQLVTVTGEPGVGKSRLIDELSSYLDGVPELVRWRQGRCLPYGEGVSFWALGEIVKAEAGILEADPPDEAGAKLRAAVGSIAEEAADRDWLAARLEPLVGLAGTATDVAGSELFTAWRTFLEALAAELVPRARESDYAEYLAPALMIKAEVDLANGDLEEAANAVREFAFVTADHPVFRTLFVPIAVRILVAADALEEAVALAEDDAEVTSPRGELSVETARAIVAEARGELADAARRYGDLAERWRSYGFSLEEGQTLLGAGRCLIAAGRAAEAVEALQRARAILSPLGVRPLLEEIDDLLGEDTALTS